MNTNRILEKLGGTNEVARLCEVSPQAVSQWRTAGIPKARLMFLRVICPDVFTPIGATDGVIRKLGADETAPDTQKEAA